MVGIELSDPQVYGKQKSNSNVKLRTAKLTNIGKILLSGEGSLERIGDKNES